MRRCGISRLVTQVLSAVVLLFNLGCSNTSNFIQVDPSAVGLESMICTGLPGLPDTAFVPHHSSALFDGQFQAGHEVAATGSMWDGPQPSLAREGLSYTVLGTLSPVYNDLSIALDGELDGLWLAVSDYPRERWCWLGGPYAGSTIVPMPPDVKMSLAGALYVLLVCPDGAAATATVPGRLPMISTCCLTTWDSTRWCPRI